jgi:hypothetical protein
LENKFPDDWFALFGSLKDELFIEHKNCNLIMILIEKPYEIFSGYE